MESKTSITLISPYSDISSIGLRILSAVLKEHKIPSKLLFIPHTPSEKLKSSSDDYTYSDEIIKEVTGFCRDSHYVGISVMTHYFDKAIQLTRNLQKDTNCTVIWGGIHPTIKPKESLRYADIAAIGECEGSIGELVSSKSNNFNIKNFWFRNENEIIKNNLLPLKEDIDEIPFQDYDLTGHFVFDSDAGKILPMDDSILKKFLDLGHISRIKSQTAYQTIASRGCPHNCAYCCNNAITLLYEGQKTLRRRSNDNIIMELSIIKERYAFIKVIGFSDDSFFAASKDKIVEFAELYKEKIDLPFFCLGSPLTITEDKLRRLIDAGMFGIQMGIQTGSSRVLDLYNRKITNKMVVETSSLLSKFKKEIIPPVYDLIIDNPFEKKEDSIQTFKLLNMLKKPFRLQIFSLVLFPATALYEKALKEGFIRDDVSQIYRKNYHQRNSNYINFLFGLYRQNLPSWILKPLSSVVAINILHRRFFDRMFNSFYKTFKYLKNLR
ncbi:B12-binding domain-containing radical SAM protein [bacterium]|nr:B12-binding domain-containing radical SAM protein [bacterium]